MAERKPTQTMPNLDRVKDHRAVVDALEALRAELGETAAWEKLEHAVRTCALQAKLLVPANGGAQ